MKLSRSPARPPTPPPFPFLKIGDRGRVNGCWKKLNALFLWIVLCSLEFYKNLKVFSKLTEEENAGKLFSFKRQIFRIHFIYILSKLYLDNPTAWGHVIYSQNWPPPSRGSFLQRNHNCKFSLIWQRFKGYRTMVYVNR